MRESFFVALYLLIQLIIRFFNQSKASEIISLDLKTKEARLWRMNQKKNFKNGKALGWVFLQAHTYVTGERPHEAAIEQVMFGKAIG